MAPQDIIKKRNKQSNLIRKMVISGMMSAITAILVFTPIGMVTLPPPLLSVTTVHVPVILSALVEGPVVGLVVGAVFGICSFIRSWESGAVGLSIFFRNPLISILPRLLVPLAAVGVYMLIRKIFSQSKWSERVGAVVASILATITNTVGCLGMLVVIYGAELTELINGMISTGNAEAAYLNNAGAWLVAVVGLPNGIAEALVAALVVPMIKTAVEAVLRRSGHKSAVKPPVNKSQSGEKG